MSNYEDPVDELADYCDRNHTDRPDADCANCDQRREIQHCAQCGADFVDGRWYTALGSTAPNGCDHEGILDDWGNEVRCEATIKDCIVSSVAESLGEHEHRLYRCAAPVTTAGRDKCDFHQRLADSIEAGRIYQRLVAVR